MPSPRVSVRNSLRYRTASGGDPGTQLHSLAHRASSRIRSPFRSPSFSITAPTLSDGRPPPGVPPARISVHRSPGTARGAGRPGTRSPPAHGLNRMLRCISPRPHTLKASIAPRSLTRRTHPSASPEQAVPHWRLVTNYPPGSKGGSLMEKVISIGGGGDFSQGQGFGLAKAQDRSPMVMSPMRS